MKTEKIVHMCIDIRGILNWKGSELQILFAAEDGKKVPINDIKNYLYDKIAEGYEVLPFGKECEGFDKKTGCPGHIKSIEP